MSKYGFPMIVAAAAVVLWYITKRMPAAPTQSVQPSTAASGLPNYLPAVQQYQVNPPSVAPFSPIILGALANPYATNPLPGLTRSMLQRAAAKPDEPAPAAKAPLYLSFNFGPSHDVTKIPDAGDAANPCGRSGCGGSCGSDKCSEQAANPSKKPLFTDGGAGVKMSKNGKQQLRAADKACPNWAKNASDNIADSGIDPQTVIYLGYAHSDEPVSQY